ncbi:MAG: type II 3-dehydroquinate dehydratase [Chloroflexi bacterium]|nr:type II 3-dehydroquinate dehydratase [Chloroflexota bacterium]
MHISNIYAREPFRQHSHISAIARALITGLGWRGYLAALDGLVGLIQDARSKE